MSEGNVSTVQNVAPKPKVKSKQLWFAFGLAFLGALQASVGDVPVDPKIAGYVAMGLGGAIAVLRKLTTQPLA